MRIETPSLIIDSLQTTAPGEVVVILNRDPEPGEVQVPAVGPVEIQFIAPGSVVDLGRLVVSLSLYGDPIYAHATGFSDDAAAASSVRRLEDGTVVLSFVPVVPMPSLVTVLVQAAAATVEGAFTTATYSFQIEDLDPPTTMTAALRGREALILTFDEAVDPAWAAQVSNFSLRVLDPPSYPAVVVSTSMPAPNEVRLELDDELTMGVPYEISAINVEDVWGNVQPELLDTIDVPYPAEFGNRDVDMYRMLPKVANRDQDLNGDARTMIRIFQDVLNVMLAEIDRYPTIYDPARALEPFLDAMLVSRGNPFRFADATINDKRQLLSVLVPLYRQKGTAAGIINAIRFFLALDAEVRSLHVSGWVLGTSALGFDTVLGPSEVIDILSFDVVVPRALNDAERARVLEIVRIMRPNHTRLRAIVEPVVPEVIDHWMLGFSRLGIETELHEPPP